MSYLESLGSELLQNSAAVPRPLLNNLEELAIVIHELFNHKQLERYPGKPLSYPQFSDLPDTLKYSNLRQARSIADKLELMGWEMQPQGSDGKAITIVWQRLKSVIQRTLSKQVYRELITSGYREMLKHRRGDAVTNQRGYPHTGGLNPDIGGVEDLHHEVFVLAEAVIRHASQAQRVIRLGVDVERFAGLDERVVGTARLEQHAR